MKNKDTDYLKRLRIDIENASSGVSNNLKDIDDLKNEVFELRNEILKLKQPAKFKYGDIVVDIKTGKVEYKVLSVSSNYRELVPVIDYIYTLDDGERIVLARETKLRLK